MIYEIVPARFQAGDFLMHISQSRAEQPKPNLEKNNYGNHRRCQRMF